MLFYRGAKKFEGSFGASLPEVLSGAGKGIALRLALGCLHRLACDALCAARGQRQPKQNSEPPEVSVSNPHSYLLENLCYPRHNVRSGFKVTGLGFVCAH